MSNNSPEIVREIFKRLMSVYGPQFWWPGDSPFEVIVGAILTQSAAWTNVEKAINNLKSAGALSPERIRNMPSKELSVLIKPSGYYNAKAKKLKAFVDFLNEQYMNELSSLFSSDINTLRKILLSIHGIGEETADSIILYAAQKPIFVIDAYTRRIFSRLGLLPPDASYEKSQEYFMRKLTADVQMFNEYHALLVNLGKCICRKTPVCKDCPLIDICRQRTKLP